MCFGGAQKPGRPARPSPAVSAPAAPAHSLGLRPQRGASSTYPLASLARGRRPRRNAPPRLACSSAPARPRPAASTHAVHRPLNGTSSHARRAQPTPHRPGGARTWRRSSVARSRAGQGRAVAVGGRGRRQGARRQRARQAGSQGGSAARVGRSPRTGRGRGHINPCAPRQERLRSRRKSQQPAACHDPRQQCANSGLDMNLELSRCVYRTSVIICALGAGETQYVHFHWPITTLNIPISRRISAPKKVMAMKRKEGWDRGRDLGEKIASTTLPPKSRHTHGRAEGTEGRKKGRIEWRKGIEGS